MARAREGSPQPGAIEGDHLSKRGVSEVRLGVMTRDWLKHRHPWHNLTNIDRILLVRAVPCLLCSGKAFEGIHAPPFLLRCSHCHESVTREKSANVETTFNSSHVRIKIGWLRNNSTSAAFSKGLLYQTLFGPCNGAQLRPGITTPQASRFKEHCILHTWTITSNQE